MIRFELSLVTWLLCGFGLWLTTMFVGALIRSFRWRRQTRVTQALLPPMREALVEYLAGKDNQTALREFVKQSRGDLGAAIMTFEGTVGGSARERLCELALDLALVHDWSQDAHSKNPLVRRMGYARLCFACFYEPCRRVAGDLMFMALDDPDDDVKLSASRALLQYGASDAVEKVFEHAVSQNLLVRILLTGDLRRHALPLCERAIPKQLESDDPVRILNVLQMVTTWERALPMPHMGELLQSQDRGVRMQALRVAALVADAPEIRKGIMEALTDSDPEVAACAAGAAARQRVEAALPVLARCLRTGTDLQLVRAAAAALAEMPPRGWATLQELSSNSNPVTAQAANEALARVQVTG